MDISYLDTAQRVALGSQPEDYQALHTAGFTHVAILRGEDDRSADAQAAGLVTLWLDWSDARTTQSNLHSGIVALLAFIESALAAPEGKLLIHCMSGRERSVLGGYVWLRQQGMSDTQARAHLRKFRPLAIFTFVDGNSYALEQFLHDLRPLGQ